MAGAIVRKFVTLCNTNQVHQCATIEEFVLNYDAFGRLATVTDARNKV